MQGEKPYRGLLHEELTLTGGFSEGHNTKDPLKLNQSLGYD